jgi:hypothetical protein
MHALRVLALCRRLEQGNADLAIATAEMQCRAGDLPGAHAGFRLALALARQICDISGENSFSPRTGHPAHGTQDCSEADLIQAKKLVVSSSARHGMCLMEARRFREAASRFREALALDQVSRSGEEAAPSLAQLSVQFPARRCETLVRCEKGTRPRVILLFRWTCAGPGGHRLALGFGMRLRRELAWRGAGLFALAPHTADAGTVAPRSCACPPTRQTDRSIFLPSSHARRPWRQMGQQLARAARHWWVGRGCYSREPRASSSRLPRGGIRISTRPRGRP